MQLQFGLIFLMVLIGVFPIILEIRLGKFDIFNLKNPFIIYYLLQLGISGFSSIYFNNFSSISLEYANNKIYYTYALLLGNLGLVFFQIGYYKKTSFSIPMIFKNVSFKKNKVYIFFFTSILFGYFMFFFFLYNNGGLSSFLENREGFRSGGVSGQGIFLFSFTTLLSISAQVYIIYYLKKRHKNVFITLLILILIVILPAFFIGFRSLLILPVISISLIINFRYKILNPSLMIPFFIVIGTTFTIYGIIRKIPPELSISYQEIIKVSINEPDLIFAVVNRSKGTEIVASVVKKLSITNDFTFGIDAIIETITIPIPRKIWTNKPQPNGEKFGNYFFSDELFFERGYMADAWGGVSPTVVGEFYWYFGLLGVVFGLYFLGRIAKYSYCFFVFNKNDTTLLFYSNFYLSFAMFTESFQGYLNGFLLVFLVLLPISFFLNYKIRLI